MKKKIAHHASLACLILLGTIWVGSTSAVELVTTEELAADRAAPDGMPTRAVPTPGAPRIELVSPSLDAQLKSPIDIRLRWATEDGASIVAATVRVLYGRLGIDITRRVESALRVSANGLEVAGAELPSGRHRIRIEVSDDRKRIGSRTFEVHVADK